jgi:lipopolysaccharide biosynthesis glycosyltransferase
MGYKNTETTRWCNVCKSFLAVEMFHTDNSRKDGYTSYCKPCKLEKNREWREKNPKSYKMSQRRQRRKREYGVSDEDYSNMLIAQSDCCAICKVSIGWEAAVDHCHKTGKVRGLLCNTCNTGIGMLKDDVEVIQNAVYYLKNA